MIALKPLHWNPDGYVAPAGAQATPGSYPAMYGFGHEEWNHSPAMMFTEHGEAFRAFHTEPIGTKEKPSCILMIASHRGTQYFLGAASRVRDLSADDKERDRIGRKVHLDRRAAEAWRLDSVKEAFGGDRARFDRHWPQNAPAMPAWVAPATHYYWCAQPVPLDPTRITGKARLVTRFTSYTALSPLQALSVLDRVPPSLRTPEWIAVRDDVELDDDGLQGALLGILQGKQDGQQAPPTTQRAQLVLARLGQGRFRSEVFALWGDACAVTGCAIPELLRASHIKSWRDSTNKERLDASNGLPLIASIDALFDRHLVSFDPSGAMVVAPTVKMRDRKLLGVPRRLRATPSQSQAVYLAHHRAHFAARWQI